jgi:hypothetical protein
MFDKQSYQHIFVIRLNENSKPNLMTSNCTQLRNGWMRGILRGLAVAIMLLPGYYAMAQTKSTGDQPDVENLLRYFDKQIYFTENKGQWSGEILYKAAFPLGKAMVTRNGVLMNIYNEADMAEQAEQGHRLELAQSEGREFSEPAVKVRAHAWTMKFEGQLSSMNIETKGRHKDNMNIFTSGFSGTDIASYQEVWYKGVYHNVDVRYYPNENGALEYDIVCMPGFDSKEIAINFDGVQNVAINKKGELVLQTSVGSMSLPAPVAYQKINGQQKNIEVAYDIRDGKVQFKLGKFDKDQVLIIDPIALRWATWVNTNSAANGTGTSGDNHGHCIWVDQSDNAIYIVARVDGQTDQITSGAFEVTPNGGIDLIVGKYYEPTTIGGTGQRVWQTYIGGNADDNPYAMEQGPDGNLYITGYTGSSDFPLLGGSAFSGSSIDQRSQTTDNTFILKINTAGNSIKAAVVGGDGDDGSYDLRITSTGDVVVCGTTRSRNLGTLYPGSGAVNRTNTYYTNSNNDIHLFKLNQDLSSVLWMNNYGGSGNDVATIINLHPVTGEIYLGGYSNSTNFPVLNARENTLGGSTSGILQKLKPNGTTVWSSYFRSANSKSTQILCMEYNFQRNAFYFGGITGGLGTNNIGASGRYDGSYNGGTNDFFVALMDTAQTFVNSTYVGGSNNEVNMMGLNVDANNDVYVFGYCNSPNFPVTSDALQSLLNNTASNGSNPANDKVFLKVKSDLTGPLLYSTYYGGSADDYDPVGERGIKFSNCRIYTIVTSRSNNLPLTAGALNTSKASSTSIYEPGLVVWSNPPDFNNNEIFGNQVVCAGTTPNGLTGSQPNYIFATISRNGTSTAYPNVITPTIIYDWQKSLDGNNWTSISGANTQNLAGNLIGNITQNTYFRRIINGDACVIPGAANQLVTVSVIDVDGTTTPETCLGASDGSITINPSGVGPFQIQWAGPYSGTNVTGLPKGSYSVTVTDSNNCTAQGTFHVDGSDALLALVPSSTPATCLGNNGSASVSITGGREPYQIAWSNLVSSASNPNIPAGPYSVQVTDALGCVKSADVTVGTVTNVSAEATSVHDVSCAGGNDGSFAVQATAGTAPFMYQFESGSFTSQNTFTGLASGTYHVTVKDANQCSTTVEVHIGQPDPLELNYNSKEDVICRQDANGSASVNIGGGTEPYTFIWSPSVSTSATASGLSAGDYSVYVQDANHCISDTVYFTIDIIDQQGPTWETNTGSIDADVECGDGFALAQALAQAPVAEDLFSEVSYSRSETREDGTCSGNYDIIVSWVAKDRCNNESEIYIQTIRVRDTTAPSLSGAPADTIVNCGQVPQAVQLFGNDACQGEIMASFSSEERGADCPFKYTITRTWTAEDNCGNSTSVYQHISVQDTIVPTFDQLIDLELSVECDEIPAAADLTASDDCGAASVTYSESRTQGCPYDITRVYTAKDDCNNETTLVQIIHVDDHTLPVINGVPGAVNVQCGQVPVPTGITATDNCTDNLQVTYSADTVRTTRGLIITRTWSATDSCGNTGTATQIVTESDTENPLSFSCPADLRVSCDNIPPVADAPQASDACGGVSVIYEGQTEERSGSCGLVLVRTWTATDEAGNSISCSQRITVVDEEAPVFDQFPSDASATCNNIPAVATNVTATDNCNGATVTYEGQTRSGDNDCNYYLIRTWSATDSCGNSTERAQYIHIQDTENPYWTSFPENENASCDAIPALANPEANDACSEVSVEYVGEVREGSSNCDYTLVRTWIAEDVCGNRSTRSQSIFVYDNTAPSFVNFPADVDASCGQVPAVSQNVTANDNCGDAVISYLGEVLEGTLPCNYILSRTWRATDACGNYVDSTQHITVIDTTAPEFTSTPADQYLPCGSQIPASSATAQDNCGTVTVTQNDETTVNGCTVDVARTFTATDNCNNSSTYTQHFYLVDDELPVFTSTIQPYIHVNCEDINDIPNPTASDNCGEVEVTHVDELNSGGCLGTIFRTWIATDECGNTATAEQYISVQDNQGPVIEVPSELNYDCTDTFGAPVPEVYDLCTEVISFEQSADTIQGECQNEYTIIWHFTAMDYCENVSEATTTIHVTDTHAPHWVTRPQNMELSCELTIPAPVYPVAQDDCSGIVNVTLETERVDGNCANTYTIRRIFSATDGCGNDTSIVQTIHIFDTTAPVFDEQQSVFEYECNEAIPYNEPSASDACGAVHLTYQDGEVIADNCYGYFIRTWTATDDCDNSSEFEQILRKVDHTNPVITGEVLIERPCDDVEGIFVQYSDNCDQNPQIEVHDERFSGTCSGHIVRTYTVTDLCGNSSSFEQIINLTDDVAPTASANSFTITVNCGTNWDAEAPVFTDNCTAQEDLILTNNYTITGTPCERVHTFTWTATDNCNNTTTITQVITVVDHEAPVFLFTPGDYTIQCNEEIIREEPVVSDLCNNGSHYAVTETSVPGTCPNEQVITRLFRAYDDCGNSSVRTQTITIVDTIAPTWNIESAPSQLSFECPAIPAGIEPTATDNCGDVHISVTQEELSGGSCSYSGRFVYVATDDCGNISEPFYQYYIVSDETAPVVNAFDVYIERPCDQTEGVFITATDNCSEVEITYTDERVSGTCLGHIIRTYHVSDACGNVTEGLYQQIINLIDTTIPVFAQIPGDVELECGTFQILPAYTLLVDDNCTPQEDIEITVSLDTTYNTCGYVINRHFKATDLCGNYAIATQHIAIVDHTAPVFTFVPGNLDIECNEQPQLLNATAFDACNGEVDVEVTADTTYGDCPNSFVVTRYFRAYDACGNSAVRTQTITVSDNTAPTFTYVPNNMELPCGESLPTENAEADDNCSVATVTHEDYRTYVCESTYTVYRVWIATDACGNVSRDTTEYYVYDNVAPVIHTTLPEQVTVSCASDIPANIELDVTDNCSSFTVTPSRMVLESDSCGNQVIHVHYVVADGCSNVSTADYQIVVFDNIRPEFNNEPADIVLACSDVVPAPATVTASDNCDNNVHVEYMEYRTGDELPQGAVRLCHLITPNISQATGCQAYYQNKPWAMWLGSMSSTHRYFRVVSGQLVEMANGDLVLNAHLINSTNAALGGFDVSVTFGNKKSWSQWSTQSFPTSFKADCGGVDANFNQWFYYLLQNGSGAELTGWGEYQGSNLNLSHAPSNQYFGFQLGEGANNLTPGYGLGGWFTYTGAIVIGGTQTGPTTGSGDFAFNLDCCPNLVITRCWTAFDCSGNENSYCQTISYEGSNTLPQYGLNAEGSNVPSTEPAKADLISISPNPATDFAILSFTPAETGKATVAIYDMAGALVAKVFENKVEAGSAYRVTLDVNRYAAGLYTVVFNNGGNADRVRLMVNGK